MMSMLLLAGIASACLPFFGQSPTAVPPAPAATRALPALATTTPEPPSPTPVGAATESATPTATPVANPTPRRVQFPAGGTSVTFQGNLALNGMDRYVLRALANQAMTVNVTSQAHMLLQVSGADGNPLKTYGAGSSNWSGVLPATQDYIIGIATEDGSAASYTVQIIIPPLATAASP